MKQCTNCGSKGKMMDCRKLLTKSLLLGMLFFGQVMCYPNGAPDSACSSMLPNHGASASTIPAPYTITASKSTYRPNEEITVTLQAKSGMNFKGFLIQPRKNDSISQPNTVGTLTGNSYTRNPCTTTTVLAALTHINNDTKTTVTVTWKAPAVAVDTVVFVATVVKEKVTYWVMVQSQALTPDSTTAPSGFLDPACGKTKGCLHDRTFLVTWADKGGSSIDFEMKARIPDTDNYWMSLGFSSDKKMGSDSCADCSIESGAVNAYSSYNPKKSNVLLDDPKYGITGMTGGSVVNGVFTCSFSRAKTATNFSSGRRKKRAAISAATFFDLNEDWYLLFAQGKGPANAKQVHTIDPMFSKVKADLQSMMDLKAYSKNVDLAKVHGSLMIVAWILLASIGTVMARFYKPVWPDSKLFGEKVWFQIHRACMVVLLVLVVASFIIIFIKAGGYSETGGWTNFQKAHPILGIIVMALTVINPVMALFRPRPDAPRRKIFNIAHFGVGTVAFLFSIINIFSGVGLKMVSKKMENVLWAYVGWFIVIMITLEIYDFMHSRKGNDVDNYELTDTAKKQPSGGSSLNANKWKPWIIAVHVVVVFGLTIALIVLGILDDA